MMLVERTKLLAKCYITVFNTENYMNHIKIALEGEVRADAALSIFQQQARYVFDLDEFAQLTGRASNLHGARVSLSRLAARNLIFAAHKRPSIWVIVPPEYRHYGAPPINWWLHDSMTRIVPNYYLSLLSAARHWGSSHYALQVVQVMVKATRPSIQAGRQKIVFFSKAEIEKTPVVEIAGEKSPLRVSTREATLLDLMRHQDKVGGIESIARIAHDFAPHLSTPQMLLALDAMGQVAVAQRLGFLLDRLGLEDQATLVDRWLSPRKAVGRILSDSEGQRDLLKYDARWSIKYTDSQLLVLDEIR